MKDLIYRIARKPKGAKEKCVYNSIAECPYSSEKECNFDTSTCPHIENRKHKKGATSRATLTMLVFALVGFIVYIIISILAFDKSYEFSHSKELYNIISSISISVVTGSILALLIDLPSRLRDYEESFINALTTNSYLKSLDENRLTSLRNDITEQLHKTKAPSMAKGLIEIDQRVCELLRQPYYTRYRHSVLCHYVEDENYIEKQHSIEYRLINPFGSFRQATEFLKFTNLIRLREGEDVESTISGFKFTCSVDGNPHDVLTNRIDFQYADVQGEFYNKKVILKDKSSNDGRVGIRVDFKDHIDVSMNYKIRVPMDDPCFSKRLQHPVKNFRLDYTCENDNVELYGQVFGTEIKQSDVSIKYTNHSISLETFDWLIPGNGAIVVMLKK